MMRWSGSGVSRWSVALVGVVALAGCSRRVIVSQEQPVVSATSSVAAPRQDELTETLLPPPEAAPATAALDIREIKLIEDNGQHGLFVKLNRPPAGVTHYSLAQPTRLVIEIAGAQGDEKTNAQRYRVNDSVISGIRVARHEGKIRLTLELHDAAVPTCTVENLKDTVIAFLGEPTGGTQPVREQVVFTRRAVEMARNEPVAPLASPPEARPAPAMGLPKPGPGQGGPPPAPADEPNPKASPLAARQPYHGQHVSLDFKDADVHNVLRLLAEVSKLNIVATDDVRGKVTLRLFDVPWDQALDIVLQVLGLESEQEGNVIRISTVKRLREEREELHKAQEAAKAVEPLRVEYIHVNYAKASKLAEIISGTARTGGAGMGGVGTGRGGQTERGVLTNRGSVFVDEFSNTLIVRDIQRGIDNARELVRRLDMQTPQVLIESNIVEATTSFARDLGVQWGYRYLAGPQTGNPTGVNFPGKIGFGGSGLGTGSGGVPFIADFPANVAAGAGSALDLALGSIDGSQSLDLRISALEEEGKARIISRPRVVTLNNVAATIKSLTILRVKLPSTGTVINTGAGGAAGTASTATEKIETGIILVVTPQVSSDGYVLLDMFAKSSQADFTREVDDIPTEISREANSHILIKDGQTVVLGGIYRDNFSDTRTGLPFFKDIPGLGWMFRNLSKKNDREDLLVFLTPRVMGGPHPNLPSAADLWTHRE
jgi:type IV pilus secretin PilQ/predicted competence protein